jgi:hypothetical protein
VRDGRDGETDDDTDSDGTDEPGDEGGEVDAEWTREDSDYDERDDTDTKHKQAMPKRKSKARSGCARGTPCANSRSKVRRISVDAPQATGDQASTKQKKTSRFLAENQDALDAGT